jgi:hypothetical protein
VSLNTLAVVNKLPVSTFSTFKAYDAVIAFKAHDAVPSNDPINEP